MKKRLLFLQIFLVCFLGGSTSVLGIGQRVSSKKMFSDRAEYTNQAEYTIRCGWGQQGLKRLAPISDVVIIVDVFSFSTSVDVATARGAFIIPHVKPGEYHKFGKRIGAIVANERGQGGYTSSPVSFNSIPAKTRLVLPTSNGATLSCLAGNTIILAGCLRNARAVAKKAMELGKTIAVIPAGARWPDRSIRFAIEDFIGAGAILSYLKGSVSPEAQNAIAAYNNIKHNVCEFIKKCSSGKKLIKNGFPKDIKCACQVNVSTTVPRLIDGVYRNVNVPVYPKNFLKKP